MQINSAYTFILKNTQKNNRTKKINKKIQNFKETQHV